MARKGRGASGGPRGPRRSRPRRRRVWRRPCGSSATQVGSGAAAARAVREGAPPQRRGWGLCGRGAQLGGGDELGKQRMGWRNVPSFPPPPQSRGPRRGWILGNAKGKRFSRDSGLKEGATRAPWKWPLRALGPRTVFRAAPRLGSARGPHPSWRKAPGAFLSARGCRAASARSFCRIRLPGGASAAAENLGGQVRGPGGRRAAEPPRSAALREVFPGLPRAVRA